MIASRVIEISTDTKCKKVKVKQSPYRPGQVQRVPESYGS